MDTKPTIDAREFRTTMSRFATGVTVVTTAQGERIHGMTANAFVSLSIDPLLVLISVDHRAQMHALLLESGRYAISILAEEQEALARHFAGRPRDEIPIDFAWKNGLPLIPHALAHVICTVHSRTDAGDHTLFLGQVEDVSYREGYPLVFYAGRFFGVTSRPDGIPDMPLPLFEDQEAEDLQSFPLQYYW